MDIHPQAKFGKGILMDHGTGIVVGQTAEIGNNVSILQNVTLGGALHARLLLYLPVPVHESRISLCNRVHPETQPEINVPTSLLCAPQINIAPLGIWLLGLL